MEKKTAYYLRTSHYLQSIGTQEDKIEPGWKIYKDEGVSGRLEFKLRPAGARLLDDCRKGLINRIVVLRIDRCGRSTKDIIDTLSTFNELKIPLTSINEGITTLDENGNQTATNSLLINLLSSLSEFFFHQNREKTLAGIERAKLLSPEKYRGRVPGSKEKTSAFLEKQKSKKIIEMLRNGNGVRSICRILQCSPNLVYKCKQAYEEIQNVKMC
jgi:DNA invertase Pin-like site-specific DNA recombinase